MTTAHDLAGAIMDAETAEGRAAAYRAAYEAGYRYAVTGANLSSVDLYATKEEAEAHRRDTDGVFDADKQWCGTSGDGIEVIEHEMA